MKIIKQCFKFLDEVNAVTILNKLEEIGRTCYQSEVKIGLIPCPKCTVETESSCVWNKYHIHSNADQHAEIYSSFPFIENLLHQKHHESIIEHHSVSLKFICNRAIQNEMVRHRLSSYAVESTRYVNYSKDKSENQITIIKPIWVQEDVLMQISNLLANAVVIKSQEEFEDLVLKDGRSLRDVPEFHWLKCNANAEVEYMWLMNNNIKPQFARDILPLDLKTEVAWSSNLRQWRHIFQLRTHKSAHPEIVELMSATLREFKKKLPIIFDDIM